MQREQRHLDREREEEREEQQQLFGRREGETPTLEQVDEARVVERAALVEQVDDRDQHQHRPGHRVEEELDGRVDAPLVAPDADQEIHRNKAHFPEHVEEEQVERYENADQSELEQQQKGMEFL